MELLLLLPFILIVVGAFFTARHAKSSGGKMSQAAMAGVWILSIIVPFAFQMLMVELVRGDNALAVNQTDWALMDRGMGLRDAHIIQDVFLRTVGVLVGLAVSGILLLVIHAAFMRPKPSSKD